jgi:hypothetical protein
MQPPSGPLQDNAFSQKRSNQNATTARNIEAITTTNSGKPIGRWLDETQASALSVTLRTSLEHQAVLAIAGIMLLAVKVQMMPLPLFVVLAALMMFAFGLMFANFTSLAMEPQGHIAGTASSLYRSITTLLGIGIGTTIGAKITTARFSRLRPGFSSARWLLWRSCWWWKRVGCSSRSCEALRRWNVDPLSVVACGAFCLAPCYRGAF